MTLCEAEDLCEYEEWNRPCKVMTKRLAKSDKEKSPCMKLAQRGQKWSLRPVPGLERLVLKMIVMSSTSRNVKRSRC